LKICQILLEGKVDLAQQVNEKTIKKKFN